MNTLPPLQSIAKTYLTTVCHTVILVNILFVGIEVDYAKTAPANFELCRNIFLGLYVLEVLVRLYVYGKQMFDFLNLFDLVIITLAIIDIWILGQVTILWRLSLLRGVRFVVLWERIKRSRSLIDLWLVLGGIKDAITAYFWLTLLIIVVLYSCGTAMTGVFKLNSNGEQELGDCLTVSENTCLDLNEYFGTVPRSMLTLLQMLTLDTWASHIIRPLFDVRPMEAVVLGGFAVGTAYGLLSIAIGVFVWSTVELAKSHGDHASHESAKEDKEIIFALSDYFRACLEIEERTMLDRRSLMDAMSIPQVATAFKKLDLPVPDIPTLFEHLDVDHNDEISVDQFERGVNLLKQPATSFDTACLTAQISGTVTFSTQILSRSYDVLDQIENMSMVLEDTFADLHELVKPKGVMGKVPEVLLRKGGHIESGQSVSTMAQPRYTG